ncbi:MFS transporter [Bordetella bronchiseptica]|uniref:MFS transporter n=1 Tax=Bordetella bronchiseptica TaxID=518 RepID=UPI00081C5CD6|nr:MFS transporter [Bordetella bronchiseptica]AOB29066.1 hypothetical protein BBB44_23755 [Bordetella bronchiseptica]AZW46420.1 MFS transporter [Bordetella bronchiseptica]
MTGHSTPFAGRQVLAASFVMAIYGWGLGFYGPPIFLHAVVERTGWPLQWVAGMVTLHFLAGALAVVNLRRLYRLAGIPAVTFCAALGSALGTFGWAVAATPWQLAIAALASGASWAALGAAAINALIEPWFVVRRPAALGMAYNGASVGGIIFSPLWALLIQAWGFAWAAGVVGASMVLVIGVLAGLVFTRTPASTGQAPDGEAVVPQPAANPAPPARPAGRLREDRRFVTLAAAMSLGLFAQMGLVAHLYSLLVPALGPATAGVAMGAATGCAIAGRTIVGRIAGAGSDRRLLASYAYAMQALGVLLLMAAGDTPALVWVGLLLFGSGIGNATSLPPLIAQNEFDPDGVRRVVPLIVALSQAAYAFAPAAFGMLRGVSDAAPAPWLFAAAAALQAAAIACLLAGRATSRCRSWKKSRPASRRW